VSKELDILTVGIVTIPFRFEGKKKINQALDGVEEMAKHVDALLVINNERLRKIYPDLTVLDAFGKADDTLSVAAKPIAEIITNHGLINLDFNDVKTVLKDGGVAIMSTGYGEGEGRVKQAIQDALNSPLLNDNDIFNSKKILLSINFSKDSNKDNPAAGGLMMEEMNEVNDFMEQFGSDFEIKWGIGLDPDLGNKVKVTILATGFGIRDVDGMDSHIKKIVQETHYVRAIDTRGRELSKSAFGFSNTAEGFESMLDWSTKLAAANDKKQIVLGLLKIVLQFQTLAGIQSLSGFGQGSGKETRKPDGV
jgi:cell division protein FtsZ